MAEPLRIRELLDSGRHQLSDEPGGRLESEILLAHTLDVGRAHLYANPECQVNAIQSKAFLELVHKRVEGQPIAYLTGTREFWSLPLHITPDVLIPRPETEMLVETALEFIPVNAEWRIADLGTGSGAIALAIASERRACEIHATEFSPAALRVARQNESVIAPGRIIFHQGSWLEPLQGKFRLIVSNPPYVASNDPHLHQGDCRYEPADALTAGRDAMAAIRHISNKSPEYLDHGGMLAFEHGFEQGEEVRQLLAKRGYREVATRKDLEGLERVTSGICK